MLSYMKCGKTECEKPRLLESEFCAEHQARSETGTREQPSDLAGAHKTIVDDMRKLRDYLKTRAWNEDLLTDPDLDEAAESLNVWAITLGAQRSETGTRELTPRECFETYRNLVWTVQEADGMNRGWVEFARRLNEIVQFRPTQAGSDTPAPAK